MRVVRISLALPISQGEYRFGIKWRTFIVSNKNVFDKLQASSEFSTIFRLFQSGIATWFTVMGKLGINVKSATKHSRVKMASNAILAPFTETPPRNSPPSTPKLSPHRPISAKKHGRNELTGLYPVPHQRSQDCVLCITRKLEYPATRILTRTIEGFDVFTFSYARCLPSADIENVHRVRSPTDFMEMLLSVFKKRVNATGGT